MFGFLSASTLLVLLLISSVQAQVRDGQIYDQGAAMTELAEGASEASSKITFLRGQWDVQYRQFAEGEESHATVATASTTFLNRGHGYMERFRCEDFDGEGHSRSSVIFLTHTPATDLWNLGIADSWNENIRLYTGGFVGDDLVVEAIYRAGGSGKIRHYRISLSPSGEDAFELIAEQGFYEEELQKRWARSYSRREESSGFMEGEALGEAAPGLPTEAHQFDFLLGERDTRHELTLPSGQVAKWPSNATAVRMLDGHAIMEHAWYDVDPNLPDAATTILRIYNRSTRTWESMYTANRGNNILFFGGVKEGDEIILHSFDRHLASGQFSYWTFHTIEADSYGWFANTSTDRGETFKKTWIIEATRKPES